MIVLDIAWGYEVLWVDTRTAMSLLEGCILGAPAGDQYEPAVRTV